MCFTYQTISECVIKSFFNLCCIHKRLYKHITYPSSPAKVILNLFFWSSFFGVDMILLNASSNTWSLLTVNLKSNHKVSMNLCKTCSEIFYYKILYFKSWFTICNQQKLFFKRSTLVIHKIFPKNFVHFSYLYLYIFLIFTY